MEKWKMPGGPIIDILNFIERLKGKEQVFLPFTAIIKEMHQRLTQLTEEKVEVVSLRKFP
ncbi:8263_t:CDS:2 [Funneliformis mosseae]|uniref:8263_t:CDS:1 n=1 Tax=Funneliformis mosseae TaxID=27381 RepID=A0A9N9D7K1_FUNMO|nr:8263_t:CDS:2 [Funneliformis mosseae]